MDCYIKTEEKEGKRGKEREKEKGKTLTEERRTHCL
jgi:hypothetical protein